MDDDLTLPADTLAVLNEFLAERSNREHEEKERIISQSGKDAHFEEDWQLSQFWYNESTKRTLGRVASHLIAESTSLKLPEFRIALLSCPSLYGTFKDIHESINIFEYDKRFGSYGSDFVFYDFNEANDQRYLEAYHNMFDLIIADPPFLSKDCMIKISKIICNLQRTPESKVIVCSGKIVEPWLTASLPVSICAFNPEHERNLGNEFVSYANFNVDQFTQ